ncbi:transmembrane protein, putative (macronuclear) [Tetrahymena thermophila SB210]|uniref:Transmembrane protein, putative n=1 Tax=Tetrahymena thermophila (strain SB210) TaxID=312017 RepID=W7X6I5_TETTS|nr:transmembrane protein, putative [Tetrahymena thermophila SB210]EWS71973.1 transmembrane protein, putative [Tetrahymena thermophila SB210]|eukprot:XP_012655473.1 transmembrane protein, putative [Tetrahymena thermophila SB210]
MKNVLFKKMTHFKWKWMKLHKTSWKSRQTNKYSSKQRQNKINKGQLDYSQILKKDYQELLSNFSTANFKKQIRLIYNHCQLKRCQPKFNICSKYYLINFLIQMQTNRKYRQNFNKNEHRQQKDKQQQQVKKIKIIFLKRNYLMTNNLILQIEISYYNLIIFDQNNKKNQFSNLNRVNYCIKVCLSLLVKQFILKFIYLYFFFNLNFIYQLVFFELKAIFSFIQQMIFMKIFC